MDEQTPGETRLRLTSVEGNALNITINPKEESIEFRIDPNAWDRFTLTAADIGLFAALLKVK